MLTEPFAYETSAQEGSFLKRPMEISGEPGIYVLVTCLPSEFRFEHRSLGVNNLHPGIYCYCGSAGGPGGLNARIKRHLIKKTRKFWHFDYLKEYLQVIQVWWQVGKEKGECDAVQLLAGWQGAHIPVHGFGSSDCRNACASHLVYFENIQSIEDIYRNVDQYGFAFTRKKLLRKKSVRIP